MTQSAWTFMFIAWAVIIGCTLYCFTKLLTSPNALGDNEIGDQEIETL